MAKKPRCFWNEKINCEIEVRKFLKNRTEIPTIDVFWAEGNIPRKAIINLGGREEIARMTGLPMGSTFHKRGKYKKIKQANQPSLEKWTGKPSNAFRIEAEARKRGLCYADIQKQKTLAMVGGVQK